MKSKVDIHVGKVVLTGSLTLPENGASLVILTKNRQDVAEALNEQGIATLIIDLMTPEEQEVDDITRHLRFDIAFLTDRLVEIVEWALESPKTKGMRIGLFGSSTTAAAALNAAVEVGTAVGAVVSFEGRPDLAGEALKHVAASTLLIVKNEKDALYTLNRDALELLPAEKKLLAEESPKSAALWFARHL